MAEVYCDIVPHAYGWVFLSEGVQSPTYPSYRMAVEAAQRHMQTVAKRRSFVLRRQNLDGQMLAIAGTAVLYQPRSSAADMR
ncbi:hypothetical protein [Rhizobium arsenicireducens]|jgi:hypothetical protein